MQKVCDSLGIDHHKSLYEELRKKTNKAVAEMVIKNDEVTRQSSSALIFEETVLVEKEDGQTHKRVYTSYKKSYTSTHYPGRLIVGMSFDITKRAEAEASLLKNINELKLAAKTKRTFVQNFRHDLKEPLSNIIGASDCLLNMDLPEDTFTWVESIHKSASQLLDYINQLTSGLSQSKEPLPIKIEPVDLKHEIQMLENDFKISSRVRNLYLNVVFSEDLPAAIPLDRVRIQRVLSNLISNGLKYTNEGGVTVTVHYTKMQGSSLLEIIIEDTGIGIKPSYLDFIFSPFTRIANQSGSDGSGLGLSIVKGFVDDLQGQISVNSEEGRGSKFIVMLPIMDT
jgi:signal transduction histidine kinase